MNKIYKVIWSKARNCWVVASEIAKNHSKGGTGVSGVVKKAGSSALLTAAVTAMLLAPMGSAWAAPVDISSNSDGSATAVFQNSNNSIEVGDNTISASGKDSIAIGTSQTAASGKGSVAIGSRVDASADHATAVGDSANATSERATAVGDGASAESMDDSAFGSGAIAKGEQSTALGHDTHAEGRESIAGGDGASALQDDDAAYGHEATADGGAAIAIGSGTEAVAKEASAVGAGSTATAEDASAFGSGADATAKDATALGTESVASGTESTSVGSHAVAEADRSVAIGGGGSDVSSAHASEQFASAIGSGTEASGVSSTALGGGTETTAAKATADGAVAIGGGGESDLGAHAEGVNSISVGVKSKATEEDAVAIGTGATAEIADGVALGSNSKAVTGAGETGFLIERREEGQPDYVWTSTSSAVSIGDPASGITRQITGVAAGTQDTDAANVAQVKAAMTHYYSVKTTKETDEEGNNNYLNDGATANNALAAGVHAKAEGNASTAMGYFANTTAEGAIAIGNAKVDETGAVAYQTEAAKNEEGQFINEAGEVVETEAEAARVIKKDDNGNPIADNTVATGKNAIAIGTNTKAWSEDATAMGTDAMVWGENGTAVGTETQAGTNASAYGYQAKAHGEDSTAIGYTTYVSGTDSTAIGSHATSQGNNSTSVGMYATTNGNDQTAVGEGAVVDAGAQYGTAVGYKANAKSTSATAVAGIANGYQSTAVGNTTTAGGSYSTAVGNNNTAGGSYATAVGYKANGYNTESTAVGYQAQGNGYQGTAVGWSSNAGNSQSTAVGYYAQGTGSQSTAVGYSADASNSQSTAVGYYAQGNGTQSTSVGMYSHAGGSQSSALGYQANANGNYSTAGGYGAVATAMDSTALGYKSTANGSESSAIGGGVSAGQYSTAVGYTTNAGGTNSTAVGNYNTAGGSYATAVGYRANGYSSESTAVGYQAQGNGYQGTAVGWSSNAGNSQSTAVGYYAQGTGSQSTAVGYSADANNSQSTAVGYYAQGNGSQSTSVGYNSHAGSSSSTAVGYYAQGNGTNSTAAGYSAVADGTNSTSIGNSANAHGQQSTAIGGGVTGYSSQYGIAIGQSAGAGSTNSTAIGSGAQSPATNATAVGYNADAKNEASTAVGKQAQAQNTNATAVGNVANAGGYESTAVGNYAQATYNNATAVGNAAKGNNYNATGVGYSANAGGVNSTAVGYNASAWGANNATAVGYNSGAGNNAAALGYGANAYGDNAAALGYGASANQNAVAAGVSANAWGTNGIALGTSANAGNDAVVLGRGAVGWKDDTIVLGKESKSGEDKQQGTDVHGYDPLEGVGDPVDYTSPTWQSTNNAVSFGRAEERDEDGNVTVTQITRQINNVAAGTLDTDVVNVAQLKRAIGEATGSGLHYFGADDSENPVKDDAGNITTPDSNIPRIHNQQLDIIGDSEYGEVTTTKYMYEGVEYFEQDDGTWLDAEGNAIAEGATPVAESSTSTEKIKDGNIITSMTTDKNGIRAIKATLNRDLEVDTIVVTGKDGKEGEPGTPGTIGINGRDGTNGLPGEDGETTTRVDIQVGPSGEPGLDGKDGVTRIIYEDGDGEHEVATLDDGLKFGANAPEEEEGPNPVPNKLNSTVNIVGSEAVEGREYSTENLTTTVGQAEDGTTTITVKMDKDPNFDTLIVNGKDGKDGEPGTPGKIGIRGEPGEDGTPGEVAYISVTNDGTPGVDGKDGEDGITRIVYTDPKDPEGEPIEVATLDDGMKYSGDFGNDKDNPVAVKLNNLVDIKGEAESEDGLTTGNIGVVAAPAVDEEGNPTGGAELKIKLNKDINLGTDGSLTVGGEVDEDGNPKTDEYGNPTSIVIGPQTVNHVDGSSETGDFIVGLDNTNWDPTNIVSGRAATEDQLAAVQTHYYSVNDNGTQQDNWLNDGATGINSLAAGTNTKASGITSTAVGHNANASVMGAVALGANSVADRPAATESGYDVSTGTNYDGTDKDSATWKATTGALSLGGTQEVRTKVEPGTAGAVEIDGEYYLVQTVETTRQITGVAAGLEDTDAVNVAQLKRLENAMQIHDYSVNSIDPGSDLNYDNKGATGDNAMAAGVNAIAEGANSTAVGNMAIARNDNSTAVGNKALASADSAVAIGDDAQANIENSVAIGSGARTVEVVGTPSYEIGGTTYNFAGAEPVGTVSVGAAGEERTITNVAAGRISEESTDAINGSQLWAVTEAMKSGHTEVTVGEGTSAGEGEGVYNTGGNLDLNVTQAEDGHNIYDLKLAKDIDVDTIVVNGKDGKDGKIGINGKDGETSYITVSGKDGAPGLDGVTTTRILIDDKPVATLDDGMKYTGDFGDGAAVKLNKTVNVVGNAASEDDLVDGNIGVTADQNGEDGKLTIKLNKDIDLGDEGSITFGDVHIHDGDEISFGDNVIHNVAPGVEDNDVVNVSQLKQYSAAARTEVSVGDVRVTEDGTPVTGGNLELKRTKDENDEHDIYDVRLAKDIDVDTIVVNGKDGKDGAVGLTGKDGVTRTITITKDGAPGLDGKDGEVRIVYEDGEHNTHEVATLDDGLKFGANKPEANSGNPVANKLNSTINILGEEPAEGTVYSTKNLTTTVDQDEDGNTTILVKMNRDLDVDSIVVNGKDGKDGTIGINGRDGTNGKDGTNRVDIQVGPSGEPGLDGKDGVTRIIYEDGDGEHEVATLDDGLKYAGDFGDGAAVKLNNTVNIKGEAENEEDLTTGNIGVVANQNPNEKDADLIIKLNKDINLGATGSITMGDVYIHDGDKISFGDNQIHNVAAGTEDTDVVNVSQLKEYSSASKTEVTVGGGVKAGTDGNYATGGNLDLAVSTDPDDGHEIYDLKLADNVELGGPGKDGKDGVNGSIGVNGKDGKSGVGIDGENGITVYGKDGKDGDPAVAINGKDGVGTIGLAGRDGTNGKDGTSLVDIQVGPGTPGLDGKDGTTRIIYEDGDGEHEVATLDDGMKYTGDFGDGANVKLNNIVNVVGNAKNEEDLTDGNIGVVAEQDGDNGKLTIKLNKDLDLTEEGSVTMGDTVINNEGMTITNGGPDGDIIINGDNVSFGGNQIHNVAPGEADDDVVNVSQLKEYTAAAKTEVTVGGGVKAGTDGNYNTGGNLDLTVSKDPDDDHEIYDLKLADNVELGGPGKDGKDGVNGSIGVNGADGKSGVGIDGKDGITVYGKDGKDGDPAVSIKGEDGVGHIGLAGPAGKDGKDGISDIHMIWGDPTVGNDGDPGKDGITRIEYTDPEGNPHQVATMDDGLYFGANSGDPNPAANKLSSTVEIKGAGEKDDDNYSGENLKTIISQEGEGADAVTTINVVMDKDLNVDNIAVNGKDGKDGTIGINGRDGTNGKDGTNRVDIQVGPSGEPGLDGKDGVTRIIYEDGDGEHEVATLDDGMKYAGDFGDGAAVKLNKTVNVIGEAKNEEDLTTGNIGVVAAQDGDNAKLTVKLNKDIDLGNKGSVTIGDTKINNEGLTINEGPSITKKGIDAGSKKITNVAPGEDDTDAVNVSQLKDFEDKVGGDINKVNNNLNKLGDRVNKVGAGAAALAGLHPLDFDPDAKWDVAAGYGHYNGENAVAIGAFYRPSEDVMLNVASTVGNGDNMISAGVSVKIGGANHVSNSRVALAKQVLEMRKEMEDMKSLMADSAFGRQLDLSKIQLFPDTPENHWAYDYVATLAGNGLLEGYPDGNFRGDRDLTRYEVAAILYRAMMNGAQLTQRALEEFAPELDRIRVDTLTRHSDGTPSIQRVRIIKDRR